MGGIRCLEAVKTRVFMSFFCIISYNPLQKDQYDLCAAIQMIIWYYSRHGELKNDTIIDALPFH